MQQLTKVDIRLAPDLSLDETVRTETTPLVESSVGGASQARWEIPGNQSADLVEAFTRKADGRIIPADPHDIATQNGVVGQAMSFVDLKLQQIPFRDVAVGDTTVLTIRFKESQHYIPGQYSQVLPILPGGAKKSLDVTLRAPATLMLYHDEKDLAYEEAQEGGDVVRHWSGSPPYLGVEETDVANLVRVVPSLGFSTFPNYEAIARGYDDGAGPMEAVTPEVQRLADEITQDKADARSQAEAIFDWVSRNIRYVAVYFGRGRYVPNDTQTILSRRFGDCKDHATLLVALLAAKGIASEQTLINLNPTYELAKTATLRAFNHVIVYIPALELYVDPTVAFGAFSRLPTADLGKPVVRVSDHGAVVARTPTPSVQDNVAELNTRIVMSADGRRQGQTTVEARGEFVDLLRRFAAQAEQKGADLALQGLAKQRGLVGKFSLDAPPWTTTNDPYASRPHGKCSDRSTWSRQVGEFRRGSVPSWRFQICFSERWIEPSGSTRRVAARAGRSAAWTSRFPMTSPQIAFRPPLRRMRGTSRTKPGGRRRAITCKFGPRSCHRFRPACAVRSRSKR